MFGNTFGSSVVGIFGRPSPELVNWNLIQKKTREFYGPDNA